MSTKNLLRKQRNFEEVHGNDDEQQNLSIEEAKSLKITYRQTNVLCSPALYKYVHDKQDLRNGHNLLHRAEDQSMCRKKVGKELDYPVKDHVKKANLPKTYDFLKRRPELHDNTAETESGLTWRNLLAVESTDGCCAFSSYRADISRNAALDDVQVRSGNNNKDFSQSLKNQQSKSSLRQPGRVAPFLTPSSNLHSVHDNSEGRGFHKTGFLHRKKAGNYWKSGFPVYYEKSGTKVREDLSSTVHSPAVIHNVSFLNKQEDMDEAQQRSDAELAASLSKTRPIKPERANGETDFYSVKSFQKPGSPEVNGVFFSDENGLEVCSQNDGEYRTLLTGANCIKSTNSARSKRDHFVLTQVVPEKECSGDRPFNAVSTFRKGHFQRNDLGAKLALAAVSTLSGGRLEETAANNGDSLSISRLEIDKKLLRCNSHERAAVASERAGNAKHFCREQTGSSAAARQNAVESGVVEQHAATASSTSVKCKEIFKANTIFDLADECATGIPLKLEQLNDTLKSSLDRMSQCADGERSDGSEYEDVTNEDEDVLQSSLLSQSQDSSCFLSLGSTLRLLRLHRVLKDRDHSERVELLTKFRLFQRWRRTARISAKVKLLEKKKLICALLHRKCSLLNRHFLAWRFYVLKQRYKATELHRFHLLGTGFSAWKYWIEKCRERDEQLKARHDAVTARQFLKLWQERCLSKQASRTQRVFTTWRQRLQQKLLLQRFETKLKKRSLFKCFCEWKLRFEDRDVENMAGIFHTVLLKRRVLRIWCVFTVESAVRRSQRLAAHHAFRVRSLKRSFRRWRRSAFATANAKAAGDVKVKRSAVRKWRHEAGLLKGLRRRQSSFARELKLMNLIRSCWVVWTTETKVLLNARKKQSLIVSDCFRLWKKSTARRLLEKQLADLHFVKSLQRRSVRVWAAHCDDIAKRRRLAASHVTNYRLLCYFQPWKRYVTRMTSLRDTCDRFVSSMEELTLKKSFLAWKSAFYTKALAKARRRQWSVTCALRAAEKWRSVVRRHEMERMLEKHSVQREYEAMRGCFVLWKTRLALLEGKRHKADMLFKTTTQRLILVVFREWRQVTRDSRLICAFLAKRNRKLRTRVFDEWRAVVDNRHGNEAKCEELMKRKKRALLLRWIKEERKRHALREWLLRKQEDELRSCWDGWWKYHETCAAFRSIARKKSANRVGTLFRVWASRAAQRHLEAQRMWEEQRRRKEVLRECFQRWKEEARYEKILTDDSLSWFAKGHELDSKLSTFRRWKRSLINRRLARQFAEARARFKLSRSLQTWHTSAQTSIKLGSQLFVASLRSKSGESLCSDPQGHVRDQATKRDQAAADDRQSSTNLSETRSAQERDARDRSCLEGSSEYSRQQNSSILREDHSQTESCEVSLVEEKGNGAEAACHSANVIKPRGVACCSNDQQSSEQESHPSLASESDSLKRSPPPRQDSAPFVHVMAFQAPSVVSQSSMVHDSHVIRSDSGVELVKESLSDVSLFLEQGGTFLAEKQSVGCLEEWLSSDLECHSVVTVTSLSASLPSCAPVGRKRNYWRSSIRGPQVCDENVVVPTNLVREDFATMTSALNGNCTAGDFVMEEDSPADESVFTLAQCYQEEERSLVQEEVACLVPYYTEENSTLFDVVSSAVNAQSAQLRTHDEGLPVRDYHFTCDSSRVRDQHHGGHFPVPEDDSDIPPDDRNFLSVSCGESVKATVAHDHVNSDHDHVNSDHDGSCTHSEGSSRAGDDLSSTATFTIEERVGDDAGDVSRDRHAMNGKWGDARRDSGSERKSYHDELHDVLVPRSERASVCNFENSFPNFECRRSALYVDASLDAKPASHADPSDDGLSGFAMNASHDVCHEAITGNDRAHSEPSEEVQSNASSVDSFKSCEIFSRDVTGNNDLITRKPISAADVVICESPEKRLERLVHFAVKRLMHPLLSHAFYQWKLLIHARRWCRATGVAVKNRLARKRSTQCFRLWKERHMIEKRSQKFCKRRILHPIMLLWRAWHARKRHDERLKDLADKTNTRRLLSTHFDTWRDLYEQKKSLNDILAYWKSRVSDPHSLTQHGSVMERKRDLALLRRCVTLWLEKTRQLLECDEHYFANVKVKYFLSWRRYSETKATKRRQIAGVKEALTKQRCLATWRRMLVREEKVSRLHFVCMKRWLISILQRWRVYAQGQSQRETTFRIFCAHRSATVVRRSVTTWRHKVTLRRAADRLRERTMLCRSVTYWRKCVIDRKQRFERMGMIWNARKKRIVACSFEIWRRGFFLRREASVFESASSRKWWIVWKNHLALRRAAKTGRFFTLRRFFSSWLAAHRDKKLSKEKARDAILKWRSFTMKSKELNERADRIVTSQACIRKEIVFNEWLIACNQSQRARKAFRIKELRKSLDGWRDVTERAVHERDTVECFQLKWDERYTKVFWERWRHRAEAQSQLTASLQTLRREFVARALRASWLAWKRRCQEAVALRVCQRSAMSKAFLLWKTSFHQSQVAKHYQDDRTRTFLVKAVRCWRRHVSSSKSRLWRSRAFQARRALRDMESAFHEWRDAWRRAWALKERQELVEMKRNFKRWRDWWLESRDKRRKIEIAQKGQRRRLLQANFYVWLERHHAAVNAEVLVDEHLEKMKMKHLALAWRSWLHVYNQRKAETFRTRRLLTHALDNWLLFVRCEQAGSVVARQRSRTRIESCFKEWKVQMQNRPGDYARQVIVVSPNGRKRSASVRNNRREARVEGFVRKRAQVCVRHAKVNKDVRNFQHRRRNDVMERAWLIWTNRASSAVYATLHCRMVVMKRFWAAWRLRYVAVLAAKEMTKQRDLDVLFVVFEAWRTMSQEKVSVRALASPSRIPRLVKK